MLSREKTGFSLNRECTMKDLMNKIIAFFADEQGGEVAEWAVVVAILVAIAVAVYGGGGLQTAIGGVVTAIQNAITGA